MLILRVPLSFDIPILDSSNDVSLVRSTQLDFHLIAAPCLRILEEKVQSAGTRLRPLLIPHSEVAQAKQLRILR